MLKIRDIIRQSRKADIRFCADGKIDISARVSKQLDIHVGDTINIMTDDSEYYLYVSHRNSTARYEGRCYNPCKYGHHRRASSVGLCNAMMKICQCTAPTLSLACGEPTEINGIRAVPIITRLKLE